MFAMMALGAFYWQEERFADAEAVYREMATTGQRTLGPAHPITDEGTRMIARIRMRTRRFAEAEQGLRDALKSVAQKAPESKTRFTLQVMLGESLLEQNKNADAELVLREAVEGARRQLGPTDPRTQGCIRNLVGCYERTNQLNRAEPLLRELADLAKQQVGADAPQYAAQLASLGLNLLQQKRIAEAEPIIRDCLAIREKKEPDDWRTFNTKSMLGAVLLGQKKYADAEPLLLAGYERMKKQEAAIPPIGKPRLTEAVERLVQLYKAKGETAEVVRWRKELETRQAASKKGEKQP
jgi:hypothetical protein